MSSPSWVFSFLAMDFVKKRTGLVAVLLISTLVISGSNYVLSKLYFCGYMSPEYLMHGKFSAKSDVFSFGVLVLEIISGKRNHSYQSNDATDLLSYAWKLWSTGTPLDLLDPTFEGSFARNEVTRCIHIGLLCVQDDPDARPSMATIVLMLNSYSVPLSLPQQPRFSGWSGIESNIVTELQSDQSISKSIQWTVNEASISEVDPR
ncbi:hypothetical protein RHSIM_Rhsim13G0159300 [Rhododendron simsii]|uniref:Serine-threonine/tyrosine-protein kinase catalytic domain-containing protein n=1 Tax=Rhododendron simsii TaxID=118357 RepID=A0A834G0Z2_RHOSS|nr:hypothetical protein RHSIM_Rhsim13G0159300 [Rhododendron simsii]